MDLSLVAMSLGAIVVGFAACYQGWRRLEPARHIYQNDPVAVRDLLYREGPVEISGVARVDGDTGTAFAPFSGTDCLAYEFEAQEYRGGGQHAHWETVDEGLRAVPFLVEDDTGAVSVDPRGAELHLEEEKLTIDPGERPPEQIERYIGHTEDLELQNDTIDLLVTELNTGNKQRFVERRLDIDGSVHVYGDVDRAPAGEWGSRTIDAVIQRGEGVPLVVSDAPERDTAWRVVRDRLLWPVLGGVIVVSGLVDLVYGLGI
jgi:hypothetical protein